MNENIFSHHGRKNLVFRAIKDSGSGEVIAGKGETTATVELSNGKKVKVLDHPETYLNPITGRVQGNGNATIELSDGREFELPEGTKNRYLGLKHEG